LLSKRHAAELNCCLTNVVNDGFGQPFLVSRDSDTPTEIPSLG